MSNDNSALIACMERAIEQVRALPENRHVHTITVTLDGRSETNVRATIESDVDEDDYLDTSEPIVLH